MKLSTETLKQMIINEIRGLLNEDNVEGLFADYQSLKQKYEIAKDEGDYETMNQASEELKVLGEDILMVMDKDDPRGEDIIDFIYNVLR